MNIWVYISNISWSIAIINVYDACITERLQNWEKLFKTFLRHLAPSNSWHYDTFQHFQHFQYGELFYNGQQSFGRVDLYFERFLQSRFGRMGLRPPDLVEWSLPPCFFIWGDIPIDKRGSGCRFRGDLRVSVLCGASDSSWRKGDILSK